MQLQLGSIRPFESEGSLLIIERKCSGSSIAGMVPAQLSANIGTKLLPSTAGETKPALPIGVRCDQEVGSPSIHSDRIF